MRNLSRLTAAAVLAVLLGAPLPSNTASAQADDPVFELRVYTATQGNLGAVLTRFHDHTLRLFEKHGMTNVGYWVPTEGEQAEDTLIYVLRHASRAAAEQSWQAFLNDPEWQEVAVSSNANGAILANIERTFMKATPFSPMK